MRTYGVHDAVLFTNSHGIRSLAIIDVPSCVPRVRQAADL